MLNYSQLKQRLLCRIARLRLYVDVHKKGRFFEVSVSEQYKPTVKWVRYALTVIGLISAFFSFQSVVIAFFFGLAVYLATSFFERIVFSYITMYIPPLPDFDMESGKWLACLFGYLQDPDGRGDIPMFGWVMEDEEYAAKIHSLFLRWAYGNPKDEAGNICCSVIVDSDDSYVFFCYPSFNRHTTQAAFQQVEDERRKTSLTDRHNRMMMGFTFMKRFDITESSYLPVFRSRYRSGGPCLFRFATFTEDNRPRFVENLTPLAIYSLKIKNSADLDDTDVESSLLPFAE